LRRVASYRGRVVLRSPVCPWCGRPGRVLPAEHGPRPRQLALCGTKGCPCIAWDPRRTAAAVIAEAVGLDGRPAVD